MPDLTEELPIHEVRGQIEEALRACPRLILEAPTGSGKSTQVPSFLLDANGLLEQAECVLVLQPRRVAARMLAKRVAEERSSSLGHEVGYQMRFESVLSQQTRLLFITEGILLRRILADPELKGIGAIIFDEFHERNLYTDSSLALALQTQRQTRPDIKLIVMSATLDATPLKRVLEPCQHVRSEGRMHPVDIQYLSPPPGRKQPPVWNKASDAAARAHRKGHEGNMLIFMPGAREIHRTLKSLEQERLDRHYGLYPLYGELSPQQQDRALAASEKPKILVATNIAETSLTIPGVTLVIDSGLARVRRFDPQRRLNSLLIETISKSSAAQRAGRAGRLGPGTCIRLWSQHEHLYRSEQLAPEIHRVDLSDILLYLKSASSETSIEQLPWCEPPRASNLQQAISSLKALGALNADEQITSIGRQMARFPLHPRLSRLLLSGAVYDCVKEIGQIVALLEERRLLLPLENRRAERERDEFLNAPHTSDFFPLLAALQQAKENRFEKSFCEEWGIHAQTAKRIWESARQYERLAEKQELPINAAPADEITIRKCLLHGFADDAGQLNQRGLLQSTLTHQRSAELSSDSVVRDQPFFVAAETEERESRGSVKLIIRMATSIEPEWLEGFFPEECITEKTCEYDRTQRAVVAYERTCFRGLVLHEKMTPDIPTERAASMLAEKIHSGEITLKNWNEETTQYLNRIRLAATQCPESGIKAIDDDALQMIFEQLCLGAHRAKEIKDADPLPALKSWLSDEEQAQLDSLAPATWPLPTRKHPAKLRYEENAKTVVLAATIQELYDVQGSSLTIANGSVPLTLEILAPNRRPIQKTQDLDAFWNNSYPDIKKQLFGRYPKHEWR